jgi:hypothetical protein
MRAIDMVRRSISGVLAAGAFLSFSASATGSSSSDAQADRMLAALGGREAWAAARSTVNDSQQNRVGEPTVVRAVITMDFELPRFRIETTGPDLHLIRVIDGERSWRKTRDGRIEPVPEQLLADDLKWYAGHVYRTIHRVARRDPAIELGEGTDGRLEVYEHRKRIAWFKLDARGEPYAFGAHADDIGSVCGPWELQEAGIRHPLWVSSSDGTWRAMVESLAVNVPMDDGLFEPSGAPTP